MYAILQYNSEMWFYSLYCVRKTPGAMDSTVYRTEFSVVRHHFVVTAIMCSTMAMCEIKKTLEFGWCRKTRFLISFVLLHFYTLWTKEAFHRECSLVLSTMNITNKLIFISTYKQQVWCGVLCFSVCQLMSFHLYL